MKFESEKEINAPIEKVFEHVSDFAGFENGLKARGAEVKRQDDLAEPGVCLAWDIQYSFRGSRRQANVVIDELRSPNKLKSSAVSSGIVGIVNVRLESLGVNKTKMMIDVNMKSTNLTAKILLKSLTPAKSGLSSRFDNRVGQFAKKIETSV